MLKLELWRIKMPTKITWEYDGKNSKITTVKTGEGKTCEECGGYDGHFNSCGIFQKEVKKGKWD